MDALVVLPGTEYHGKLLSIEKVGVVEVATPESTPFDDWEKRGEDLLEFRRSTLFAQKFRAGSRLFWVLAPYGGGHDPGDVNQVIDMLIDLDPADVRRITVR